MSAYICPYCFRRSETDVVCFQCSNPACKDDSTFNVPGPGLVRRLLGAKAPHVSLCPKCLQYTGTRVCSDCHRVLPVGIEYHSSMVTAVVGGCNAGTSVYIGVLIQRMHELCEQFNWSFMALDDFTKQRYEKDFYEQLYKYRQVIDMTFPISSTGLTEGWGVDNPLLYSLTMTQDRKSKTIMLPFFDTSGADFGNGLVEEYHRYIYNAAGIILFFDPLNIPEIHERVKFSLGTDDVIYAGGPPARDIIQRMVQLIYSRQQLARNKKIEIPLAIVCSKIDLLMSILGKYPPVFWPSGHNGHFNLDDFRRNSDCIQSWIAEYDMQLMSATKCFKDVAFFGVSALGQNPVMTPRADGIYTQTLKSSPQPIRVEDPLLWLLWENGFLKGR